MKGFKQKIVLVVFIVLSVCLLAGNGWTQSTDLPHAFFNGLMVTYLDNPSGDDLIFMNTTINSVFYSDGTSSATDVLVGKAVTIVGSQRNCPIDPCTLFTDATISVSDGSVTYFSATLTNIEFTTDGNQWYLNPGLDVNNTDTLNLSNIILNPNGSAYIQDLADQLGSKTLAGMQMRLLNLAGDITGNSTNVILEGMLDGVQATAPNLPPVASAGVTFNQDQCLGTECEVTLNGTESADPDSTLEVNDIVLYEWLENNAVIATGDIATVLLPLGFHEITLRVTDSADQTSTDTITVVIDPAELSFIEIDRTFVKRDGKIKIMGRLALPAGVSHFNVNSIGTAEIQLSDPLIPAINESVDFLELKDNMKWKYHALPATGINRFNISWDGAKFSYIDDLYSMIIKSHHIGEEETSLEIISCAAVTIEVNGVTITIDEYDNVTCPNAGVRLDGDDDGDSDDSDSDGGINIDDDNDCTTQVRLPFELTSDMIFVITRGTDVQFIPVADYLTEAVGKFKIFARYDAVAIDFSTLVPNLELTVALGDEGFTGTLLIDEATWTKIKLKYWKYKSN